jgi:hypothetical protein
MPEEPLEPASWYPRRTACEGHMYSPCFVRPYIGSDAVWYACERVFTQTG